MELTGRAALVTGGARRVGKVIALALADRGMDVFIHYHTSADEAARTVGEIEAKGVRSESASADLADAGAIKRLIDRIATHWGRLDLLVNSASTFQVSDVLDLSAEDWDHTMAVNLRAPFLLSQGAASMLGEGGGVIVNIADIAGQVPWKRFPHHSVANAGLIMLTRVLAKSFAPDIRVNAIVPGPVLKPDAMSEARWAKLTASLPLAHAGRPEHVAQAVIALAENDFATGAVLNIDGGDSTLGSIDFLTIP